MTRFDDLPAALALEVDALCDDFERHWRQARRRGASLPSPDPFLARATEAARLVLRECLDVLERDLAVGVALPVIPGMILEGEVGRGGMGVVYRARRLADGRTVAVKLIPGAEHDRWSRWLAELADLRHPHLVPLEAFGTYDGLHFVVMPFVPGGDLKERLAEFVAGHDGGCAAASLMARVADAVAFLHRRGILHRDLKPSNILLTAGPDPEPLVCDFGLAGRLDEVGPELSLSVGTPPYMAPEQREGRPLTVAADVWSLGAVLYELLTSRPPFGETGPKCPAEPPPPRERNLLVAEVLQGICLRCLRHDTKDRYAAMDELAEALHRYPDCTF